MMMLYNRTRTRTRNLPLHRLCNLAFRLPSQDSIFLPTSTILSSKGANFSSIVSPFSLSSQTLVNSKRFYCAHPAPPTSRILQWYFAKSFQTVPYTNRTRRILYPIHIEKRIGEADFQDFIEMYRERENEGLMLSPTHPGVVRVQMILDNIIHALQRDLIKMGNATSSYNSIEERILMTLLRKTPPATTSHLDGLDWDVFVVNDPHIPDLPFIQCFYSEGKIVVNQYLVNRLADIEIATVFGHHVARVVARLKGEEMSKEMWIHFLNNILGENFTKHIGQRIVSFIQQLPFNTRLNKEAEYIGLQILASAGYDPQQVVEVYERLRIIEMFSNDGKQNFEAAWEKPLSVYKIQTAAVNKEDKISSGVISHKSRMSFRFPTFGKFKVFPEKHDESFKKRILDPGSDIFLEWWKRASYFLDTSTLC